MLSINVSKLNKGTIRARYPSFTTIGAIESIWAKEILVHYELWKLLTCQNCHVKSQRACTFYRLLLKTVHFSWFCSQVQGEPWSLVSPCKVRHGFYTSMRKNALRSFQPTYTSWLFSLFSWKLRKWRSIYKAREALAQREGIWRWLFLRVSRAIYAKLEVPASAAQNAPSSCLG